MKQELGFADVKHLEQGVIDIIPHDYIEITLENIQELQQLVRAESTSVGILINCQKNYSYTFDAMLAMRDLVGVEALATYSENNRKTNIADILFGNHIRPTFPFKNFIHRNDAVAWLHSLK